MVSFPFGHSDWLMTYLWVVGSATIRRIDFNIKVLKIMVKMIVCLFLFCEMMLDLHMSTYYSFSKRVLKHSILIELNGNNTIQVF